ILVLDGSLTSENRLRLLEAGADDCVSEPFSARELAVRLRVLLRRNARLTRNIRLGELEVDTVRRQVRRQGKGIPLTAREFSVLECLIRNPGQPVARSSILSEVWGGDPAGRTNIVDVYINYLRNKIDRDFEHKL